MGCIEQDLGQNETLIYKARFHWLYFAGAWTVLILLIVSVILIIFYAAAWVEWVLLCACIIGLLCLLRGMIPIWTTEIAVTNHRLIVKRGWLSRSTDELQLKVQQGFLGRLFGFGRIDVHGTGLDDLRIPAVAARLAFLKRSRVRPDSNARYVWGCSPSKYDHEEDIEWIGMF
jgi:membrane protein YdbS with pleckstrin-like domain